MTIQTGYQIANITALQALTSGQRVDGYARFVETDAYGKPSWYMFVAASTATADGDLVVMPSDDPSTGRWLKSGAANNGSIAEFGGGNLCASGQCAIGSKAFQFYAAQANLQLIVVPGLDISITSGSTSIQLHKWDQQPNTSLNGRTFVTAIPNTGGNVNVTIDSTYRWISFFAKNPANNGYYDGVCFTVNGNVCTLIGFS